MTTPRTKGILNTYNKLPNEIQAYFNHFPQIANDFPWDVSISYMFSLIELAHNMTIYCGVVKLHSVDATLARNSINAHHMSRKEFSELYETIFAKPLPTTISAKIANAEKTRDRILHGKSVTEQDKRKAVCDILEYADLFNKNTQAIAGFKPFGSLKGFKGRAKSLDKSTSRWILKGIGLTVR